MTEDKAQCWFVEGLDFAGIADRVRVLSVTTGEAGSVVEFIVAVPDVADWELRYAVLQVAQRMEDDHDLVVFCYFREQTQALAASR